MRFSNINPTLKIAKVLQTEILRRSWFFLHWCQLLKLTKEYFSKGIYGRTFLGELNKPGTYDKSRELVESLFFLTEKNGFFKFFLISLFQVSSKVTVMLQTTVLWTCMLTGVYFVIIQYMHLMVSENTLEKYNCW